MRRMISVDLLRAELGESKSIEGCRVSDGGAYRAQR